MRMIESYESDSLVCPTFFCKAGDSVSTLSIPLIQTLS